MATTRTQRIFFSPVKKLLASSFLLLAAALVTAVAPARAEALRIAAFGPLNNESIAVAIALDQGLYKEAGIDAELITFKGGAPAVQALAGKAVDVCICSPEHVIRLTNRGLSAHVIVPLSNITSYVLFGPKDSPVGDIAQLKGKKIGITSPGSKTDGLVRLALERAGLNPDKDASIVGIGGSANNLAAIKAGHVDVGMVSGLEVLLAEQQFTAVYDWRKSKTASLALIGLDSWAKANPELVRKFIQTTLKAAEIAAQDKTRRDDALLEFYPNIDAELIRGNSDRLVESVLTRPRFTEAEFETLQSDTLALEPELKPISYDAFNPDFLGQ
ncbi:ABC transporter substrate-binding protein [Pusillimonas sp.]|uniref:ABC transporter substrate-binding protein n=1 Tax=Pusillimonas sp. TaxID=3040095 RepID=UPI0029B6F676|nr:ABC transporter substrate-binding protein [Pusillimonas sp.]MDX3893239.1 ABC transporter substrate-binding protein [Pusillimonas sp.]